MRRQKEFTESTCLWRFLRNKISRQIKWTKQDFYKKSLKHLKCANPRDWHREIKKLTGMNNTQRIHLSGQSAEYSAAETASRINEHFVSVASDLPCLNLSCLPAYLPALSPVPTISPLEMYGHKSGGPGLILSWLIREFSYEICFPLSDIFNCSLKEGTVPDIWKSAFIVPVPKYQPHTISNLRPILLTCVFAKVLEDFVTSWLKVILSMYWTNINLVP